MMLQTEANLTEADRFSLFTASQLEWLNKAKRFADTIPLADCLKSDSENVFRRDLFEAACKQGFGSLPFPDTYGGSNGDYVSFVLINEEFAKRCMPFMSSLGVHVLCQEPVSRFGTHEQKEKYLRPSATGKYLAAFGLTEPAAGSDTAALETTAKLEGDSYVLNGTKTFITSGGSANYFIVMAKLADAGITAFIVDKESKGFEIGQKFDMLGMRGYATCELVFSDCIVPKENLLGAHGEGRKVALSSLAKGRVTIAAQATGWAQGALDTVVNLLKERIKKDDIKPSELETCKYLIGDLATKVASARALMHQAAYAIDRGAVDVTLAGMAKIQATDTAMHVSTEALSLAGKFGAEPGLLLERIFRDAKAGQIYEGTNQIQRMLIARSLIK